MVCVTIDGREVEVDENTTVADLMKSEGIDFWRPFDVPQIEFIHNEDCPLINVVEVDGALATPKKIKQMKVRDGMKIETKSEKVKKTLEERLKRLESREECHLIRLLQEFTAIEAENAGIVSLEDRKNWKLEGWKSEAIMYDPELCIRCGNCVETCKSVQSVEAIKMDEEKGVVLIDEARCTRCGQCIHACPMGIENEKIKIFKEFNGCELCPYSRPYSAIREVDHTMEVWKALKDEEKFVVVQFAPSMRVSIGEMFGMKPGEIVVGKIYAALRRLGFDRVWDTNFAADETIMEEGTELICRFIKAGIISKEDVKGVKITDEMLDKVKSNLPQFTSCSPGWVKFCETFYPELISHISSAKSPQQMFGATAKTYAATKLGIDPRKVFVVSIMPCTAKKFERGREEMCSAWKWLKENGYIPEDTPPFPDVDVVLTTREFAKLLKMAGINLAEMPDEEPDSLLGKYTGAAAIFGRTGGVMEAALRTAYELITGKKLEKLEWEELETLEGIKSATIKLNGKEIKVAVAHGLGNARKVCESVKNGGEMANYHFIEFMACPGGCIGGGGQPEPTNVERIKARIHALNVHDRNLPIRKSHENPEIIQMYEDFFEHPVSEKAHELLHTSYIDRSVFLKS